MIKKILKALRITFLTIFLTFYSLFLNVSPAISAQMNPDSNGDNSMGIVIEESSVNLDGSETSAYPDLGDDQAFPFIPGFGKNSGKD